MYQFDKTYLDAKMADMRREAQENWLLDAIEAAAKATRRLFKRVELPRYQQTIASPTDSQTLKRVSG